jgi:hypothetical protein
MPEEVISSINKMQEALKRLTRADAESVAADAAARAEAVADYAERIGRTANQPG